jgi:hypothetical protein
VTKSDSGVDAAPAMPKDNLFWKDPPPIKTLELCRNSDFSRNCCVANQNSFNFLG